ncbi:MAG: hypothetical protein SF123_23210 [Chloroflexota bacterium]|nr:hypothetical protein [Chloroflexota bacterium]
MVQTNPAQEAMQKAQDVQQRYQNYLLNKPHVVGVGVGYALVHGAQTPEVAVVVMVDHKLPPENLSPMDRLPSRLEGVRIDVQETGTFDAFNAASV